MPDATSKNASKTSAGKTSADKTSAGKAASALPGLVLVGRFGAPHGVRGEIRLRAFTADPKSIASYGGLVDGSGARVFQLKSVRHVKDDMLVAQVLGIGDRSAAEMLTNIDLYVAREKLPPPDEDEFYLTDLEGLEARLLSGEIAGRVLRVENHGAGDILVIQPPQGEQLLVAFTRRAVPEVQISEGYLVIDPPDEIEAKDDRDMP